MYSSPADNKSYQLVRHILLKLGTNSLEIYFLHYFLLFPLPVSVGQYLDRIYRTNFSLSMSEFLLVGTFATIISISSILLSRILKLIPYMSLFLFGGKTRH